MAGMRARIGVALAGAFALAVPGVVLTAPPAAAAGCITGFTDAGNGICTADFVYTGAPESFTLPANVTWVDAVVSGAEGGASREEQVDPFGGAPSPGGLGGRETARVTVPAGATLTVVVGQAGGTAQTGGANYGGGYGGGGSPSSNYGGGGGGGSFLWDVTDPVNGPFLLAAAGGGGGGGYDHNPIVLGHGDQQNPGGAGAGAATAGDGQSVPFCCDPVVAGGGAGASASGGGLGGVPQLPAGYAFGQATGGNGGGPAVSPDYPGRGGDTYNGCCYFMGWAGGGGGGYYGGGGGGSIEAVLEGGGGGGGAGYVDPTATNAVSATGVQLGDGMVTVSYDANATLPPAAVRGIAVGDVKVVEGDARSRTLSFPVTLPAPSATAVSVPYTVTGAGATWGKSATTPEADFGGKTAGVVSFPVLANGATGTTKYISVPVYGDVRVEDDEELTVTLGTPTSGPFTVGRTEGTGVIVDDDLDPSLRVTVGDVTVVEGESGQRIAKVPVTVSAGPGAALITVPYSVVGTGGAVYGKSARVAGADYGGKATGTLTFTGTQVAKLVAIPWYGDTVADGGKGVQVVLGTATGAAVTRASGALTILDDD